MNRTETKGAEPNYYALHCPCGDGFIWRTDDTSKPYLPWLREHNIHDTAVTFDEALALIPRCEK